jgi:NitT/TauT family transport system substrate-binding protein
MRMQRRALVGLAAGGFGVRAAHAQQERVTYLLPAPAFLPAFIPHQLALRRGHFAAEGVAVTFQTAAGGANVATQIGAGNVEIGGGTGETTMIVRPNGLPVRAVALLGGRPLWQIAVRRDGPVRAIGDLRGKRVGVIGFQDTGYYSLLGALAASGLRRADVNIQAVGPAGITQLMVSGGLDAIMSNPDWSSAIEGAGVALEHFPIDAIFPAMAQAILTSDRVARERPAAVRGVVRGVLRAVREAAADPDRAAADYVAAVPQHAGKQAEMAALIRRYASEVWRVEPPAVLGRFDPARLAAVQRFYLDNQIIQTAVPVEELYSNEFIGG